MMNLIRLWFAGTAVLAGVAAWDNYVRQADQHAAGEDGGLRAALCLAYAVMAVGYLVFSVAPAGDGDDERK